MYYSVDITFEGGAHYTCVFCVSRVVDLFSVISSFLVEIGIRAGVRFGFAVKNFWTAFLTQVTFFGSKYSDSESFSELEIFFSWW